jgi:hypothetical protein
VCIPLLLLLPLAFLPTTRDVDDQVNNKQITVPAKVPNQIRNRTFVMKKINALGE